MDKTLWWVVLGAVSLFVLAPMAAGLGHELRRRREEALGSRRKSKIRL